MYAAKVRASGEAVSIFVCDLRELTKQITKSGAGARDADAMIAHLRQDIKTLVGIRHPCVIKVVEVIPETAKFLSVVTEPVNAR